MEQESCEILKTEQKYLIFQILQEGYQRVVVNSSYFKDSSPFMRKMP
jgi:hypothetical protein